MSEEKIEEEKPKKFEIICGIIIAAFAVMLSISNMGGGNVVSSMLISYTEKSNAYQWFTAKGIKQNLAEGQVDTLKSLLLAGTIQEKQVKAIKVLIESLEKDVTRYKKEKKEILVGSAKVGKDNWIQDVEGKLGEVIGAKEWEERGKILGVAQDTFDLSSLFLQICMVIGAVSLILHREKLKWIFLTASIIIGTIGVGIMLYAYKLFYAAGG